MKTYVRIIDGSVVEVIQVDDGSIPIADRYTPQFLEDVIDVTNFNPLPTDGMTFDGESFHPYEPPKPTKEEVEAQNKQDLKRFSDIASAQKSALSNRIGILSDAVELEMATAEESAELPIRQGQLLDWKKYAIFLGRVTDQDGWALSVKWPDQPSGGMDLSVSSVAKS